MRGTVLRCLVALAGLAITATAVASAVGPNPAADGPAPVASRPSPKVPSPRIIRHPDRVESASTATFAFVGRGTRWFQCRLDAERWRSCRSPVAYKGLAAGRHRFRVRALARSRNARRHTVRHSRARRFTWLRAEARKFSILRLDAELGPLYPGAPATALPLRIENPNEIAIFVTSLGVSAATGPEGCDATTNLELIPAGVSESLALRIPAGGSATVPAPGIAAPAIALRDLPVNQDACQGARFELSFSGSAHG